MIDVISGSLEDLENAKDQLGELDGLVGDGDLGITVEQGARASVTALQQLAPDTDTAAVLRAIGSAFGSANPSTFGALIRAALSDAARALTSQPASTPAAQLGVILASAVESIARRGKTTLGDKTVLDAIAASADIVGDANRIDGDLLGRMADAAAEVTQRLEQEEFKKGRAAWVGSRGAGVADPGSVAYIAFLRAVSRRLKATEDRDPASRSSRPR
jgi:dihydroxyacetone kinase-like protein